MKHYSVDTLKQIIEDYNDCKIILDNIEITASNMDINFKSMDFIELEFEDENSELKIINDESLAISMDGISECILYTLILINNNLIIKYSSHCTIKLIFNTNIEDKYGK